MRTTRPATDPSNLHRVMPAEGGMRVTRAAIVLAGGDPVEPHLSTLLSGDAIVIAADSGVQPRRAARAACRRRFVGDFDSADPAAVERARVAGAVIEQHPAEKDATDLEPRTRCRASEARRRSPSGSVGPGGRPDHLIANFTLFARRGSPTSRSTLPAPAPHTRRSRARRRPLRSVTGLPGSLVTLLPVGGDAYGITTAGLQYLAPRRDVCDRGRPGGAEQRPDRNRVRRSYRDIERLAIQAEWKWRTRRKWLSGATPIVAAIVVALAAARQRLVSRIDRLAGQGM